MYRPEPSIFCGYPAFLDYEQRCALAYTRWYFFTRVCIFAIAQKLSPMTGISADDLIEWMAAQPLDLHCELDSPNGWFELARTVVGPVADDHVITVH